jgi:hypothetical protein
VLQFWSAKVPSLAGSKLVGARDVPGHEFDWQASVRQQPMNWEPGGAASQAYQVPPAGQPGLMGAVILFLFGCR